MILHDVDFKSVFFLATAIAIGPIIAGVFLYRQAGSLGNPVFIVVCAVCAATLIGMVAAMMNRSAKIEQGFLLIKSTFYSKRISLAEITEISLISQGSTSDLIGYRTNGVGLPGFRSGWFEKKSGRGRLFVDVGRGAYLLIQVNGVSEAAVQFSDNEQALAEISSTKREVAR